MFDLKVIFSLLAEGPQISRDKLTEGGLLIENAHDKVHVDVESDLTKAVSMKSCFLPLLPFSPTLCLPSPFLSFLPVSSCLFLLSFSPFLFLPPHLLQTVCDLSLSPDGGVLATAAEDGHLKFWEVNWDPEHKPKWDIHTHMHACTPSPPHTHTLSEL